MRNLHRPEEKATSSAPSTPVLRRLGQAESVFHFYNSANPCAFSLALHLSRRLTHAELQATLQIVADAHPLLTATVGSDSADGSPTWVRTPTPVPLKTSAQHDLRVVLADEQADPFTVGAAPQWRVVLIDGVDGEVRRDHPDARCTVVLTFDHRIVDGMGAVAVLRDLLRGLNDQRLEPHLLPEPQESLLPKGSKVRDTAALGYRADPRLTEFGKVRPYDGTPPLVTRLTLSAEQTTSLTRAARAHAVTVQTALAAGATVALSQAGRPYVRIVHPTDLRRLFHLSQDEAALRLMLAPPRTGHAGASPEEVWRVASDISQDLGVARNVEAAMDNAQRLAVEVPETPEQATQGMLAISSLDLMLTNLGVVDLPDGDVRCVGLVGPCMTVQIVDEVIVGVTTFDGRMTLTAATRADLPGLLDGIVAPLLRA